jgi:Mg-chelatase subunit ChlD
MARKLKTFVAFIVDSSGSMSGVRKQTIDNFNEQLQVLKKESNDPANIAKKLLLNTDEGDIEYEGLETWATVVTFNNTVNVAVELADVNEIQELTEETYRTDGTTNLLGAIGETVERFQKIKDLEDPKASALFIILTDGEHNVQCKYTLKDIKSVIKDLEANGKYTFTYMGTTNALEAAADMGINLANTASFSYDAMDMASTTMTRSLNTYYAARSKGVTQVDNFYDTINEVKDNNVEGSV